MAKPNPFPSGPKRPPLAWTDILDWLGIGLDHCKPVRVSLLVLILAGAVITNVGQATELFLIALWVDPSSTRYIFLLATSALAGLAVWYAAQSAYRLTYPRWPALQDPRAAGLRRWIPRLLGIAVPLLVLYGYLIALRAPHPACATHGQCLRRDLRSAGLLMVAAAMIVFFIGRQRVLQATAEPTAKAIEPRVAAIAALGTVPLSIFLATLILNVFITVLVAFQPRQFDGMGALAVALMSASFFCMSGGFLCMLADRHGVPLLSLLAATSLVLHAAHLNDNHRVRQYPGMTTHQRPEPPPPDTRPDFKAYTKAWLQSRCNPRHACPMILVSTEGGGLRSAAWTAMVLSEFTAQVDRIRPPNGGEPWFERYLFAGSGVSGGSLGLAVYVAALRMAPATGEMAQVRSERILDHDFLAPVMANAWFIDFTQRWLPGAWFDDRGRALTRAWEQAAQEQGVEALGQAFSRLYESENGQVNTRTPALFFNSTTVGQGRRFIQHPFRPFGHSPWTSAYDGPAWLDPRIPLSEVVLNSARFTYLSPAGTLQTTGADAPRSPPGFQLVDGGYFENSGATTLFELIQRLRLMAASVGQPVHFIVLHISNDPGLRDFVDTHDPSHPLPLYSAACPRGPSATVSSSYGEATAPVVALLDTRDARGEFARAELLGALQTDNADPEKGDVLWHLRLCPGNYPLPLGWTISTPVLDEMHRQLEQHYPLATMGTWLAQQIKAATPP